MITVLIGHRGSGKTAFLSRLDAYLVKSGQPSQVFDLDREIVRRGGRAIETIFEKDGEEAFRRIEGRIFRELLKEAGPEATFISLGAGFSAEIPPELRRLWLRRPTDPNGRIFLARPRLNHQISAFDEFLERFSKREARYQELASDVWTTTEGFGFPNFMEESFVLNTLSLSPQELEVGGILSLLPENFRSEGGGFGSWLDRKLLWKGARFEIRDDLLSADEIREASARIPAKRVVYSFRRRGPKPLDLSDIVEAGCDWDWPLELGELPTADFKPSIWSLHERLPEESVSEAARRLEEAATGRGTAVLKLAVEIRNFAELWEGYTWAEEDLAHRAFLPRSIAEKPGRWMWFRSWTSRRYPVQFLREGNGTSLDQPTLMEWLRVAPAESFAAILGDPVIHSRTPAEQFLFFRDLGLPVLAIALSEDEWDAGAIEVLQKLGLRYAAVTSPLKLKAFALCGESNDEGLGAINTLYLSKDGTRWHGRNTDLAGFKTLRGLTPELGVDGVDTAIWGGGGTLEVIRRVLPAARAYSVRTGLVREGEQAFEGSPKAVIWAVGRSRSADPEKTSEPPASWKPAVVVDLNYGEDSPGREYSLQIGARYVSGLEMFRAQAREQRVFWESMDS